MNGSGDEVERLNDLLAAEEEFAPLQQLADEAPQRVRSSKEKRAAGRYCQWSAEANDIFRPAGPRRERLDAAVYEPRSDDHGLYLQRIEVVTDNLIELDEGPSERVLTTMRKFWRSKERYVERGILYKRGVLIWGPAGSGKTATLSLLSQELMRADGVVVYCGHPEMTAAILGDLRRIEPERNLILIMEDIDELIHKFGEHGILALLDGETQIANVVNLATTNYPERLGARIVNRPSRFDERILIDMPSVQSRRKYLQHVLRQEQISEIELERWVEDTRGFSIAHLRELAIAVYCLDQEYRDVLERLGKMQVKPKSRSEFSRGIFESAGFAQLQTGESR